MNNRYKYNIYYKWSWLATVLSLVLFCYPAWAASTVSTPVIKTIDDKAAIPGETIFTKNSKVTITGTAQKNTEVAVLLYLNGEYYEQVEKHYLSGKWWIEVPLPGEGAYGFQVRAVGKKLPFVSPLSLVATVAIDLTPPKIDMTSVRAVSYEYNLADFAYVRDYGNNGAETLRADVIDPVVGNASSGLDFTTRSITLEKKVGASWFTIAGTTTTDEKEFFWWNPSGGFSWNDAEVYQAQYRVTASIKDNAGNQGNFQHTYFYDPVNPAPIIDYVYDPKHDEPFQGEGETASNTPDANGWVKYYENIYIRTNPTKIKGHLTSWNYPKNSGFGAYRIRACKRGFGTWYSDVSSADGTFLITFNRMFPIGTFPMDIKPVDSAERASCDYVEMASPILVFDDGVPRRPEVISVTSGTFNLVSGNEHLKSPGDLICPDLFMKCLPLKKKQTAFVNFRLGSGVRDYDILLSRVVLPKGQIYYHTPGQYDEGEVFQDLNYNGKKDDVEDYFDDGTSGQSISDGVTADLPNKLLNRPPLKLQLNLRHCMRAWAVNDLGFSPCRGVRAISTNNSYPPTYTDCYYEPLPERFLLRNGDNKPTKIYYTASSKVNYTGGCCWIFGLDYNKSTIRIINEKGVEEMPAKSGASFWKRIYRQTQHQATIDCSTVDFSPDATYHVEAKLVNYFGHVVTDTTPYFKVDRVAPISADEQPPPGGMAYSFSSFNARIVDPALTGDNSPGTGVEMNPLKDQIWAYKRLSKDTTAAANSNELIFDIDGAVGGKPVKHDGTEIRDGFQQYEAEDGGMEVWEIVAGKFTEAVISSTSIELMLFPDAPYNKMKLKLTGAQFQAGKTYVVVYLLPCFTSNNGVDRVAAVPISSITTDGEYFVKIRTLDKAGNKGTIVLNYTRCKVPTGPFSITPSKNLVMAGLIPPDFVTFTSSQIKCGDGTPIADDQEVALMQSGVGDVRPPDANGIVDDGIQVPTGVPGDPVDNGRFQCDFVMNAPTAGSLYVMGFIGEASGTSPTVTVNLVDSFAISPAAATLDITPEVPNPAVTLTCSSLRDTSRTRNVPDNSLASWTFTTAKTLSSNGNLSFTSSRCFDTDLVNACWNTNSAVVNSWVRLDLGAQSAMSYTKVRLNVQGGAYAGIYDVEYSDNGSTWAKAAEGLAPGGFGWAEIALDSVGPHRYWRLLLMNTPGASSATVREMEWIEDGMTFTADEFANYPGVQTTVSGGVTSLIVSANTRTVTTVSMYIGGTTGQKSLVTFRDKYPPPPPAWLFPNIAYSAGSCRLDWPYALDKGGAGTREYRIEKSSNGGTSYSPVGNTTNLSMDITGLTEGAWLFRVAAIDHDNNTGDYRIATRTLFVDSIPPTAVPCTDNGAGNSDPDYRYSADSSVYFYWHAVDALSGVDDVRIQIATDKSFSPSSTVFDDWIGNINEYCYSGGVHKEIYYARVMAKDRAGNVGSWGAISDGIQVFSEGAMNPPVAPTILSVDGKPVFTGLLISTNKTENIEISGNCESENLIELWIDGSYYDSFPGNVSGNYLSSFSVSLGTHQISTRAQNGFGSSEFSATATVLVERISPAITLKVIAVGNVPVEDRNYLSTKNELRIQNFNFVASDKNGSGIDATTASMSITDIDDPENPITGNTQIISADTFQFQLVGYASYDAALTEKHRYRVTCRISDIAGNIASVTKDFVIDNTKPGLAPGMPVTTPPNCSINKLYVYDLDTYPWPAMPPADAIVPLVWNAATGAFMVDPGVVSSLVTDEYSPRAILFYNIGVYGSVHVGENFNPPVEAGKDSFAYRVEAGIGCSSTINLAVDGLENQNTFRFPWLTLDNGMVSQQLKVIDTADNRDYFSMTLNIRSPKLRPEIPSAVQFHKLGDPASVYTVYPWDELFPMSGVYIENREVFVTDNNAGIVARVTVPVLEATQTVEIIDRDGTIIGSGTVAPGGDNASIELKAVGSSGRFDFQVRSVVGGTRSLTLPRKLNNWYYYCITNDTLAPELFGFYPTDGIFNRLSDPDAKPFPMHFTAQGSDMASETAVGFLRVAATDAALKAANGTVIPGSLTREYDTSDTSYRFSYDISSVPATDGTYYYVVQAEDAVSPGPHPMTGSQAFKLDSIPPDTTAIEPAHDGKVYGIESFNAVIADPDLPDGTSGTGPNLDVSNVQIRPYKLLSKGKPTNDTQYVDSVLGYDMTATDHTDKPIEIGSSVLLCELTSEDKPVENKFIDGIVTGNSADILSVTSSGLEKSKTYGVLFPIPFFTTNDGVSVISAVPNHQAVKGGYYLVCVQPLDNALNRGSFVAARSLLEAAIGEFTLYPQQKSIYIGLIPPHVATFTSSPILTTEGVAIPGGVDVTVTTNKGSFVPPDSNARPRDGHQVKTIADGSITFGLAATGKHTGIAEVKAKLGLAIALDKQVSLVQLPDFTVTPSAESVDITKANPNPVITFTTATIGNPGNVVPDGTLLTINNSFGTLSPGDVNAAMDGHQVRIRNGSASFSLTSGVTGTATLEIQAGGVTVNKTVAFNDRWPPDAPGDIVLTQTFNNTGNFPLTCGFTTDNGGSDLQYYIIEMSSLTDSVWSNWKVFAANKAPARSFYFSGFTEGKYKFRSYATDNAGNKGNYSNESSVLTIDKTSPTGSVVINSTTALYTTTTEVTLLLTAADDVAIDKMCISNDKNNWTTVNFASSYGWSLKYGDGNKIVYVKFIDKAGNESIIYSDGIGLDSTGPQGTFNTNVVYAPTTSIKLLFTAMDMNGVDRIEVTRAGDKKTYEFAAEIPYELPSVSGAYTLYAQFFDNLGNASEKIARTVYLDKSPPPVPVMVAEPEYASGTVNTVSCNPVIDALSPGVKYQFDCSLNSGFPGSTVTKETSNPFCEFTGLQDGKTYYYRVRSIDSAGNMSVSSAFVYSTQDITAPVAKYQVSPYSNNDPNVNFSRDTTVAFIGYDIVETSSGVDNAYVQVAKDVNFASVIWEGWAGNTIGSINRSFDAANGTYLWARAQFKDKAGNISGWYKTNTAIAIDLMAPIAGATTDTSGNADPNHTASKNSTVRFTFSGSTDPGFTLANIAKITLDLERADTQAATPVVVDTITMTDGTKTSYDFTTLVDGYYRAHIKVTDKVDRESAWGSYSDGIWVDTVDPEVVSVTDDGEYSGHPTTMHAAWEGSDSGSGIVQYEVCLGTVPGAADTVAWTNVGTAKEKTFLGLTQLKLDGVTLYYFTVRATDKAGNTSTRSSDGIKAGDPTPPDPVTVTDDGAFTRSSNTLHAIWTQSFDEQSGINRYEYGIGTAIGTRNIVDMISVGVNLFFTNSSLTLVNGTTYYIHVRAVNGGNTPAPWSVADGITCDLMPPPVPVLNSEPIFSSGTSNIVSCPAVTDAISGGVEYYFERATNAGFTAGVVSSSWQTSPVFSFNGLTHGKTYWFRVKTRDAVQNESAWSAVRFSTQDSNFPTGTYIVADTNNDPDVNWSRDTTVTFIAKNLTDDLSGVQDVLVEISDVSNFSNIIYTQWIGNKTGEKTETLAVPNGTHLWARAKFKDVAGNISNWNTTPTYIAIDLNPPVAAATTDHQGNTDPSHVVSSDTNILFTFPDSTDANYVPKNVKYNLVGTLKSVEVVVEVSDKPDFSSTSIATDVVLAGTDESYYFTGGQDNKHYRARIMATDKAGWTTWGDYSDGIYIDYSPPRPLFSKAFWINEGELTTASNFVKICLAVTDYSDIASVSMMTSGWTGPASWTTWPYHDANIFKGETAPPPEGWHEAMRYLTLCPADKFGPATVTVRLRDIYGHTSEFSDSIIYINATASTPIGGRNDPPDAFGERLYPIDTYDEYRGQNKYGVPAATTGRSIRIGQ